MTLQLLYSEFPHMVYEEILFSFLSVLLQSENLIYITESINNSGNIPF
jgi:hypothetical protein